jgi:hypothetical protein
MRERQFFQLAYSAIAVVLLVASLLVLPLIRCGGGNRDGPIVGGHHEFYDESEGVYTQYPPSYTIGEPEGHVHSGIAKPFSVDVTDGEEPPNATSRVGVQISEFEEKTDAQRMQEFVKEAKQMTKEVLYD